MSTSSTRSKTRKNLWKRDADSSDEKNNLEQYM
jgi:hypothetical protein